MSREAEYEVLSSIYGENISCQESGRVLSVRFALDEICVIVLDVDDLYPEHSDPIFSVRFLIRNSVNDTLCKTLTVAANECIKSNSGGEMLYQLIELTKELIEQQQDQIQQLSNSEESEDKNSEVDRNILKQANCGYEELPIFTSQVLTEKKSCFLAHVMEVHSMTETIQFREAVVTDKRFRDATHNIFAYRFADESTGVIHHDCDDDGETAAGGRLAEMIRLMQLKKGVAVIVSRWFGGTLLGPDRFKFICKVARNVLEENGFK